MTGGGGWGDEGVVLGSAVDKWERRILDEQVILRVYYIMTYINRYEA